MIRYPYLGTSGMAAAVLEGLCDGGRPPSLVVTPPDRPRGRGRREVPCEAARVAGERGLAVHKTPDVNAAHSVDPILADSDGLAVVCDFGQIIGERLLAELLLLNVHPSLLPRWRGAAPIERAIMAGDRETGVTVIRLEAGLDSGPIALAESTAIGEGETYGGLSRRLAEIGHRLAGEAIDRYERDQLRLTDQPEAGVTYAERISKQERRLDPQLPAPELERKVRALTPHIGAYLELEGGARLGIESASVADPGEDVPDEVGSLAVSEGRILLACGSGVLSLNRVKPAGGRAMEAGEFLRGNAPPGSRAA